MDNIYHCEEGAKCVNDFEYLLVDHNLVSAKNTQLLQIERILLDMRASGVCSGIHYHLCLGGKFIFCSVFF